jgi:Putative addiction module component
MGPASLLRATRETDRSIFDLSPAEKLQLVEDLWDDLAAAPEVEYPIFRTFLVGFRNI